ncbi:MAG: UDP-N-acetylmuramate--L-alanine ligase [Clostridia bacterium]|nr:UDP-N-acetylmuramate--L-alanine ligase [Clostridia bacterium]
MNITLRDVINNKLNVYLIGIGGISMRSLAIVLKDLGCNVHGSDRSDSPALAMLESKGIKTYIGHDAANMKGVDFVIRTAAIPDNNCEVQHCFENNIPIIERADAWGVLMNDYKNVVCVAGTHGKTSTTSMISTFALKSDLDPTIMVGGELASIGGSMRIGGRDLFVAEACEYKNSYHKFSPTIAVILNVDVDHLDFFTGLDDIIESFRHFANQVPDDGVVVANYDDENTRRVIENTDRNVITFGLSNSADVYADFVKDSNGFFGFSIYHKGNHYCDVKLSVPGRFNVLNALASAAVAIHLGVDGESFKKGIQSYTGVGRRMEYKTTCNRARVFDDYAHHPNEIVSALKAADAMSEGKTICIFQPHTYTRTESLFNEFVEALSHADIVVLAEIFAAREINVNNTSSAQLAEKIPNAHFFKTFDEIACFVRDIANEGDIILTMGAGDVYKISDLL